MPEIKVLLVDDHGVVRDGLKMMLDFHESIIVCGEAETLQEASTILESVCPDVVLLDYKLPDGDGVIGCQTIKKKYPSVKIIILTAYAHEHIVMEAIKAGADSYLLKDIDCDELINTIISVCQDDTSSNAIMTNAAFRSIKARNKIESCLSPKEENILQLLSAGKANKEIAVELDISDKTVRNYISSIFKKLNVSNRTEAANYWIRNSLLE